MKICRLPGHVSLLTVLMLLAGRPSQAQTLPPLQAEQDACGALELCGQTFFTPYSYTGFGRIQEQVMTGPTAACFYEGNAVWFRLEVATSGTIVFTITPVNTTNDYDFSIFNITGKTCDSINAGSRVRCNGTDIFRSPGGLTGLSDTGTLTVTGPGPGVPFIAAIHAVAGETYLLMVDNFNTTNVAGFTIDFAGSTATFAGQGRPAYDSVLAPDCDNSRSITVRMNKRILCNSIAPDASDFRLEPPLSNVMSVSGLNCGGSSNGYTQELTLIFGTPLPGGAYTLKPATGTDGNTLLDLCLVPQLLTDSIGFSVISPLTVDAGPDTVTCIGNSLQLQAQVSGGGGSNQVQWSPATYLDDPWTTSPVSTPLNDITYVVTVIPDGRIDCAITDTVQVAVLQGFDLRNNDTAICYDQSVLLEAAGDSRYHYTWAPSAYLSDPSVADPTATPDTTIRYTVTASFPGCRDSMQSVTITVEPLPVVMAGRDTTLCYGDTLRMHPAVTPAWYNDYRYSWAPAAGFDNPAAETPLFTARDTTTATLTVTTQHGCTGSATVRVNVVPGDFLTLSSDTAICPGDTAQLQVSGGTEYRWYPPYFISDTAAADPYVYPPQPATYTVFATNTLNCRDTQHARVGIHPAAVLSLPDSARIYPGESYRLHPGGNCFYYEWTPPAGLDDPRSPAPTAMPDVTTRYYVTATTEWGCPATDSADIYVNDETLLDLPNAFSPGSASGSEFRIIKRGQATLHYFRIFNRWGQEIFSTTDINSGWDGRYNGKPVSAGVYIYTVEAVTSTGRVFRKNGNVTLLR